MSIQGSVNSMLGSAASAIYLLKDIKFKSEVSKMSKYITLDKETGSNTILSKPKDAPYVWSKGNAPTGGEGEIIPKSKVLTAETLAALKSLKLRQMLVMNTELGTWEDLS